MQSPQLADEFLGLTSNILSEQKPPVESWPAQHSITLTQADNYTTGKLGTQPEESRLSYSQSDEPSTQPPQQQFIIQRHENEGQDEELRPLFRVDDFDCEPAQNDLANAFLQRKQALANKYSDTKKSEKAVKMGKTKEELAAIRKEMMKSKRVKEQPKPELSAADPETTHQ